MNTVQQKCFVIVAITIMLCLAGLVMSGTAFAQQCVDNGDGTVTDNSTGLMWQLYTVGPMNWYSGMGNAISLSLAGHSDWRLPSRDELLRLYKSSCKNLLEDQYAYYWSSTTHSDSDDFAWLVHLNGGVIYGVKSNSCYVRAVRSEQ